MTPTELLDRLKARGITLRATDGRIQANRPNDILADERELVRQHKAELLALLQAGDEREFFEERAAIREFDGKLDRADAELLAARDCGR